MAVAEERKVLTCGVCPQPGHLVAKTPPTRIPANQIKLLKFLKLLSLQLRFRYYQPH